VKAYQSPLFREEIILEVEPEHNQAFPFELKEKSEVRLLAGLKNEDEILLESIEGGKPAEPVRGADALNQRKLRELVESSLPHLSWVLATRPKDARKPHEITIAVRPFATQTEMDDPVEIGVDDKIVDDLSRKKSTTISAKLAMEFLADDIFIECEETGKEEGSNKLSRAILSDIPQNQKTSKRGGFRIFGRRYAVDVAMPLGSSNMRKLEVIRLIGLPKANSREKAGASLFKAPFFFKDSTVAEFISGKGEDHLREIADRTGSYLRLWRDYNNLERKNVFEKARKFDFYRYDMFIKQVDGTYVFRVNGTDAFASGLDFEIDSLVASNELPAHLKKEATVEELGQTRGNKIFHGKYKYSESKKDHTLISISPPQDTAFPVPTPPKKGLIYLGTRGDEDRLARREFAERSIRDRANPMPSLMLLLQGESFPVKRGLKIKPLSEEARKSIGGEPTSRQKDALDIALNTPDVALIQGPPGTGKTRIIAALQKRLSSGKDKQNTGSAVDAMAGSILVTGYQHDAVANVASASEVFGLPAIKVGGKQGLEQEEMDGFEKWRRQRVIEVEAQLSRSETPVSVAYRKCYDLSTGYVQSPPTPTELKRMVRNIIELASPFVESVLLDELQSLANQCQSLSFGEEGGMERAQALKAVRALRTDLVSFSDDGSYQAQKALIRCDQAQKALISCDREENLWSEDERNLLEKASGWDEGQEPEFLSELQVLKESLVAKLLPSARGKVDAHADEGIDAKIQSIVYSLSNRMNSDPAGAEEALYDYHDRLKNDRARTRRAVERYSVVLAATCQQAVSRKMGGAKFGEDFQNMERERGRTAAFETVAFETIVVDEAARANPLDLLIPMSLGKRRIVLVGDHRQLPHMLEPEIEKEMEGGQSDLSEEILRQSLFERLFKEMQLREKKDGVKRTVTLDVQFRMHPLLGSFVSDNFYKHHGEEFRSEKPAEEFVHGLSEYGQAVVAWLEVPFRNGPESGTISKKRSCEAKRIAKEVHAILSEKQELSVGVITFYSDQVKELNREMEKFDLTEPVEYSDSYRTAEDYRFTQNASGKIKERLRVGTVDAFQGMEFDVVILSMTRSNDITCTEKNLRRKYGHLVLENRLCVAMSRQQRLLIVAGDSGMLDGKIAAEHVRGLVKFKEMCQGEHGCEIR
jgi:hypothetical protein